MTQFHGPLPTDKVQKFRVLRWLRWIKSVHLHLKKATENEGINYVIFKNLVQLDFFLVLKTIFFGIMWWNEWTMRCVSFRLMDVMKMYT